MILKICVFRVVSGMSYMYLLSRLVSRRSVGFISVWSDAYYKVHTLMFSIVKLRTHLSLLTWTISCSF